MRRAATFKKMQLIDLQVHKVIILKTFLHVALKKKLLMTSFKKSSWIIIKIGYLSDHGIW